MESEPMAPSALCLAAVFSRSAASRMLVASGSRFSPAGLNRTDLLVRSNNSSPSSPSKRLICMLRGGCEMCNRSAARRNLFSVVTATKYLRCRSSMESFYSKHQSFLSIYWKSCKCGANLCTSFRNLETRVPLSVPTVSRRNIRCMDACVRFRGEMAMANDFGNLDVLVIGGGNAALCAAITALENGASVLILECSPKSLRGGNSRHTRNMRLAHEKQIDPYTGDRKSTR